MIDDSILLLSQIENELVAGLQPMLLPLDADGLKQVEIAAFSSAEDIAELLQTLRSRLPGAYLNIPTISYDTSKEIRAADMTLDYAFLVGTAAPRGTMSEKKKAAYYFHDQFHRQFFYRKINNCEIPANLDFIRPTRFEVAEIEDMLVTLTTFSITVRNWQIRDAER